MKFILEYPDVESWPQLVYRLEALTKSLREEFGTSGDPILPAQVNLYNVLSNDPFGSFRIEWSKR